MSGKRPTLLPPAMPGRVPADDPRFAVAASLERPEAIREAVASGRIRALNAETAGEMLTPEPLPTSRRTAPEVALSTKVPDYVLKQLRRRYAEDGTTIRNQLLLALRLAGLEIREADVQDERKRGRGA